MVGQSLEARPVLGGDRARPQVALPAEGQRDLQRLLDDLAGIGTRSHRPGDAGGGDGGGLLGVPVGDEGQLVRGRKSGAGVTRVQQASGDVAHDRAVRRMPPEDQLAAAVQGLERVLLEEPAFERRGGRGMGTDQHGPEVTGADGSAGGEDRVDVQQGHAGVVGPAAGVQRPRAVVPHVADVGQGTGDAPMNGSDLRVWLALDRTTHRVAERRAEQSAEDAVVERGGHGPTLDRRPQPLNGARWIIMRHPCGGTVRG